jgi:hypothetical protein
MPVLEKTVTFLIADPRGIDGRNRTLQVDRSAPSRQSGRSARYVGLLQESYLTAFRRESANAWLVRTPEIAMKVKSQPMIVFHPFEAGNSANSRGGALLFRGCRLSRLMVAALLATLICVLTARAEEERIVSKYTSTARAKALSYEEGGTEGDPGFHGVFAGFGGYELEHNGGDERSWINLRFKGEATDLYAATMAAGGGTFPHKANDAVEWRGVEKNGRFTPFAIIYRLKAGNDETRKWHTRLIVIKLDGMRSKVIGHTSGPNEDAEAKQLADRSRQ